MKTTRGLAAAAAIAALAISTTGALSDGFDTDSEVRQMRASMLDVRDGRASVSELAGGFPGIPEPVLQRSDVSAPENFEPVDGHSAVAAVEGVATVEPTIEAAKQEPTPEPTPVPTRIPYIAPLSTATPIPEQLTKTAESAAKIDTLSTVEIFVQGWTAGGGDAVSVRLVVCILGKESGGDPGAYNPAGPFYGLMQFLASTWNAMGGGDWRDPYTQGVNTAKLWKAASPASQWPAAYRLCTAGG